MQAGELLKLIKDPRALKAQDVAQLEKLTQEFPYFQSARLLLSMAARRWDASTYQNQLKRTAIAATSRSHLYDLIKTVEKEMLEEAPEKAIQKSLPELPTHSVDAGAEDALRILSSEEVTAKPEKTDLESASSQSKKKSDLIDDFLEKEILKQATAAVIDKEIINSEPAKASVEQESEVSTSSHEPESFSDWLEQLKQAPESISAATVKKLFPKESPVPEKEETQPVSKEEEEVPDSLPESAKSKRLKQKAIIDKIIESSPGAIRPKEEQKFFAPERKAKESLLENEHLVTETLAKIYAMQGNIAKAVRSYEILSLKYPQKSAYFASLIQKLKQNQ